MEFHVGDIVELTVDHPDGNAHLYAGDVGRVCNIDDTHIAVDFDTLEGTGRGHTAFGTIPSGNGWWVDCDEICLVTDDQTAESADVEVSEEEFEKLLCVV